MGELVRRVPGPIIVTGVGGFVGAHLALRLQAHRDDVFGTARSTGGWRFETFGVKKSFATPDVEQLL